MSLITSVQTGGSHSHQTTSEEANFFATDFVTPGVIGILSNTGTVAPMTGGYSVNAQGSPNMTVAISTGICYVTATPTGQGSQCLRVRNTATITQSINANATGSTRWDFIYTKVDPDIAINPDAGGDDAATINVSRSTSPTTDNGTPPAFGTLIAVVTVANGASSITNGNIRDARAQAGINPSGASSASSWLAAGYTPNTVVANGNRSYSLTFNSADLTGFLSPGMRLRTTRTNAAPTRCTLLNGTTQFYNKTTPAAMAFTDDFTVSAWVKLTSYGAYGAVASRYNGTSGWALGITATGQLEIIGFNAGAANKSYIDSYQAIPLNKWVHIAAQLDMSSFTNTPTTSYTMIDGVDVPGSVARAGTNPTALIQAGNLEIGSQNAGANPFPGKIAQVAIYNSKVTQANILATISQGLVGTETSLISAYSFDNSINDLNANANNLTANGAAVATTVDSPFSNDTSGVTNHGIITKVLFSTNTTLTVQVAEGGSIPTVASGISAVSYSSQKVPYGFPAQKEKWRLNSIWPASTGTTSNATFGPFSAGGWALTVPIGDWDLGWQAGVLYNITTTKLYWNLSSAASPLTGLTNTAAAALSPWQLRIVSPSAAEVNAPGYTENPVSLTSQTVYTIMTLGATNSAGIDGSTSITEIFARCAYL